MKKIRIMFIILLFLIFISILIISFGKGYWREEERRAKIALRNNITYRMNLFQTIIHHNYPLSGIPSGFEDFYKLEIKILNILLDLEKIRIANESFSIDNGSVYIWHENTKESDMQNLKDRIQGIHVYDQFYKWMREEYKHVYYLKPEQVSEGFRDPFDSSSTSHYRYYGGGIEPDPEYYFVLASNGPNQKQDIDVEKVDIFKRNLGFNEPFENYLYDPTNGLFSNGDIILIKYTISYSELTTN